MNPLSLLALPCSLETSKVHGRWKAPKGDAVLTVSYLQYQTPARPDDEVQMYSVYLKYWTLNLMPRNGLP